MRARRKPLRARKEPTANLTHIWYWLESNQDHIGGRQSTLTTATSMLLQRLLYELVYGNLIILNELQLYLEISLSWVSCDYSILVELEFIGVLVFVKGEETEETTE